MASKLNVLFFGSLASLVLFGSALLFFPGSSSADGFYRWLDKGGRTVYGSKPPAGARDVKLLHGKPLSRYSSDKMLNRLGWKDQHNKQKSGSKSASGGKSNPELPVTAQPAKLEHETPQVSYDESGSVSACQVKVNNSGKLPAQEVSTAFEFSDGTLIPALGPETIEAESSAVYTIPEELLPLRIARKGEKMGEPEPPRVIVHGASQ
jgi:hypothetical protein